MKTIAKSFVAAAALLALAAPALAVQDGAVSAKPKAAVQKRQTASPKSFAALDKDNDGQLSREEFLAAGVPSPHQRFMECDTDASFSLSPDEYAACMSK